MARTKAFNEEEALDKALYLFWEQGYNATSVDDLVQHLGISRSSLYATFGDKHRLFLQSLARYRDQSTRFMETRAKEGTSALEAIRGLFVGPSAEPVRGCFAHNTASELGQNVPEAAAIVTHAREDAAHIYEALVRMGQATGEFSADLNPACIGKFLLNLSAGLQVANKAGQSQLEFEQSRDEGLKVLQVPALV